MRTTLPFSILAVATLMAPTAMAVALPDAGHCTDHSNLVQRVKCTVDAINPLVWGPPGVVNEVEWAKAVALGLVDQTCRHVTDKPCAFAVAETGVDAQLLA